MKLKTTFIFTVATCLSLALSLPAQTPDDPLWIKAQKIHHAAIVIDTHSHPMFSVFSTPGDLELGKNTDKSQINFVTMKEGGLDAFFFHLPMRNDAG